MTPATRAELCDQTTLFSASLTDPVSSVGSLWHSPFFKTKSTILGVQFPGRETLHWSQERGCDIHFHMMTSVAGYWDLDPWESVIRTRKQNANASRITLAFLFITRLKLTLRIKTSTRSTARQRTKSPLPLHQAQPRLHILRSCLNVADPFPRSRTLTAGPHLETAEEISSCCDKRACRSV